MKVCKGHLLNIQELASKHLHIVDIVIMLKSKWVFSHYLSVYNVNRSLHLNSEFVYSIKVSNSINIRYLILVQS
jgi:hypothetical protein